ncbi:flavin monoamine oxidase family protein [Sporosarcina siberiensis]|uniref:Flavin monoamine oxidase family protein n=1 Tax=Sporosarcina siberiensis TaxID=1365606 RepID=A0ABW4SIJ8_9BACL
MSDPVIIVGAGVSGLRAALLLSSQGIECKVFESRNRIGGRVLSKSVLDRLDLGEYDLGPTWFWPQHEHSIIRLVNELDLNVFEQYTKGAILFRQVENGPIERHVLPEGANPKSVRLGGGMTSLAEAIAAKLPIGTVELSSRVTEISIDEKGKTIVQVNLPDGQKKRIRTKAVILALPPRIVAQYISFTPALPLNLKMSLEEKSTWMGGQAKVIAVYDRPFWREDGLSGQAISRVDILQEIHDASVEEGSGALFGFFGISSKRRQEIGEEKILELVIDQLVRFFGPLAAKPISLLYKDWSVDSETAVDSDSEPITAFPDYSVPNGLDVWENKVFFAGTETSSEHGGHLEGALLAAERAVTEVLRVFDCI